MSSEGGGIKLLKKVFLKTYLRDYVENEEWCKCNVFERVNIKLAGNVTHTVYPRWVLKYDFIWSARRCQGNFKSFKPM